jgi:glycine oxidase
MRIRVIGAGVAGLTTALEFARAGCDVELIERNEKPGTGCSTVAGGLLGPWCEKVENPHPLLQDLGLESIAYWIDIVPVAQRRGTLVVTAPRDKPELHRFGRQTSGFETCDAAKLTELEPDLSGRFEQALYFRDEAHLEPRAAVAALAAQLATLPRVTLCFCMDATHARGTVDWTIDCRGLDGRDALPALRGVRGEMLVLATREIALRRPIRFLHPRHPIYIVPRMNGRFMIGATSIETESEGKITARSAVELLNAAYAVHPAFGEAEIVQTGVGHRPAFPDNLPKIRVADRMIFLNGLYRHGFLLAPALARRVVKVALDKAYFPEVMDEYPGERQGARNRLDDARRPAPRAGL